MSIYRPVKQLLLIDSSDVRLKVQCYTLLELTNAASHSGVMKWD
jgi:hypothetical protein